ncbi:hypothetical protein HETIRDRAFT_422355 [Heterobasidion irregulare TC 32-1]|uniref:CXC domain-containing protein n=1 Tax=Heterobasidion irregulare (strain TC 32-1) TaxID=747525 RepID=W4JQ29_HETIT|nr:uncharacterized protein HETIRDRAFT_422355 [Heterobasidion irregulare TC 32-1]ETW75672.1 hypothetical protein HETIRDRAFT_422355 [Heterobasidion irregulare TC 32-1]
MSLADPDRFAHRRDTRSLIESVYREVWNEFYAWEQPYSARVIASLAGTSDRRKVLDVTSQAGSESLCDLVVDPQTRPSEPIVVETYNEDGSVTVTEVPCEELPIYDDMTPHPSYDHCTPMIHSVSFSAEERPDLMAFIPYADDPEFPLEEYAQEFAEFAWQDNSREFRDPDHEVIQAEALQRLHIDHGVSLEEIDRHDILPESRRHNASGLIWDILQRDPLPWPGNPSGSVRVPLKSFEVAEEDLRGRLDRLSAKFCPSLNCMTYGCLLHPEPTPKFAPLRARTTADGLLLRPGEPCDRQCFRHADALRQARNIFTPARHILTICGKTAGSRAVEAVGRRRAPSHPRDLSRCRSMRPRGALSQAVLRKLIPDEDAYDVDTTETTTRRVEEKFVDDKLGQHNGYVRTAPCVHTGPCDASSGCACFDNQLHCSRNCRCKLQCTRRWKGCKCAHKWSNCGAKNREHPDICPCRASGRECNVELCGCGVKYHHDAPKQEYGFIPQYHYWNSIDKARGLTEGIKKLCSNAAIQRGDQASLEIRRGMYGLGAFALRTIEKDQYIGEYVGELFSANRGDVVLECVTHCLVFVCVISFSRPYPVSLADIAI